MNNENMRLALRFFSLSLLLLPVRLSAQGIDDFFERFFQQRPRVQVEAAPEKNSSGEVKLDYNVHMDYAFVNNEFDRSSSFFIPTGTIAAARVSPYIGLKIDRGELGRHRLMGGLDIMKNFGENPISWGAETSPSLENLALFREITLWYQYTRQFGGTTFNMAAGVFPRHLCGGKYTTAVFSDGHLAAAVLAFKTDHKTLRLLFDHHVSYRDHLSSIFLGNGSFLSTLHILSI